MLNWAGNDESKQKAMSHAKAQVRTLLRDIKHLVCNVIVIAWDNDLLWPQFF